MAWFRWVVVSIMCGCVVASGCSAEPDITPDPEPEPEPPRVSPVEELADQGLGRYLGAFEPVATESISEVVTRYRFGVPEDPTAEPRGPLCLRGTEFTVDTREGEGDDLFIWLHEGGGCWETFCAANEQTSSITGQGILDTSVEGNPLADYDLVYVPYCDGSLFAGDVDRILPPSIVDPDTDGDTLSFQRGLQNLSAALDVAKDAYPSPSRIVITGASGGGFGTITGALVARLVYPDAEILVINDSGLGIARDGEPEFLRGLLDGWNATNSVIPASCEGCIDDGHITPLIGWHLERDEARRVAPMTHSRDGVIVTFFLMEDPATFERAMLRETRALHQRFPQRYKRFVIRGRNHSALLNAGPPMPFIVGTLGGLEDEVDGVSALEWITSAVEDSEAWVDLEDPGLADR